MTRKSDGVAACAGEEVDNDFALGVRRLAFLCELGSDLERDGFSCYAKPSGVCEAYAAVVKAEEVVTLAPVPIKGVRLTIIVCCRILAGCSKLYALANFWGHLLPALVLMTFISEVKQPRRHHHVSCALCVLCFMVFCHSCWVYSYEKDSECLPKEKARYTCIVVGVEGKVTLQAKDFDVTC